MPELPEAETVARALRKVLPGRAITQVEVRSPKLRTSLEPLKTAGLEGRRITAVRRRGRYVVLALEDGRGLLMHLGMSGVVRVESPEVPRRRHEHVLLHLDSGLCFRFEDPRRFGALECLPLNADGLPSALDFLGPEPLSEAFDGAYLFRASRKRRTPAKVFLMDNEVVTGVGNIYATESLFAAGVSPRRAAGRLTRAQCEALASAVKAILARAIEAGGTTIADFQGVDGTEGQFTRELRIYGREGQPCPACGTRLKAVQLGGRTSCYCPRCQK